MTSFFTGSSHPAASHHDKIAKQDDIFLHTGNGDFFRRGSGGNWENIQTNSKFLFNASRSQALRVAREELLTPSSVQTLTASSAILANAGIVQVSAASAITLTSTPTIAAGIDGQLLKITNVGLSTITLQDRSALAGSNLVLSDAAVFIKTGFSLELIYFTSAGAWCQLGMPRG